MRIDRTDPEARQFLERKRLMLLAAGVITLLIFAADLLSPLQGAVAVLYIIVVLLVARASNRRAVLGTGIGCAGLTLLAFAGDHLGAPLDSAYVRLGVSLVAIAATTLLSIRDQSARMTLAEQARILELSHDTVIIRDAEDVILHWNEGAEHLYGWTRDEAVGKRCTDLLRCEFPGEAVAVALAQEGQWSGELVRTRRDGSRIVLASRWLLRRDPEGRGVGVIESSADLTEQQRADAERQRSEQRYATIFNAAGFAIWEADWSEVRRALLASAPAGRSIGAWLHEQPDFLHACVKLARISDVNAAAVALFGASGRDALIGRSIVADHAPESGMVFAEIIGAIADGAEMAEAEVRYLLADGRSIDVVLRVRILPEGEPWSRALLMAIDVTERNEARAKIEQTSAELAHAARVSTLGQLAASIAHEVNQPLSAIINYGKSGKRWLSRDVPDTDEVASCLDHIVANGSRAADVIARVRSLARKGAVEAEPLNLAELVEEAQALIHREARSALVAVHVSADPALPLVLGDRVQIQQVLVNLLMNGVQAMCHVEDRPRELHVRLQPDVSGMIRTEVADSGTGISGDPGRIFEPFFTTKREGMGMGLSICRSIIEAQGGRIQAANNPLHGATICFTLPVAAEGLAEPAGPINTSV